MREFKKIDSISSEEGFEYKEDGGQVKIRAVGVNEPQQLRFTAKESNQ